jgi:ribosomal protein S18 acetylase RimI-like enzyme
MNKYSIRNADLVDSGFLSKISSSTFLATYVALNPENEKLLAAYVAETFNEEKIKKELTNKNISFYIIETQNEKIGYAKTVRGQGPSELNFSPSLEVEKLYVIQDYKGKGLGRKLFEHIKLNAIKDGNKSLWLSVYDQNKAAIDFYLKIGFKKIGEKDFIFNWNGLVYRDRDWLVEYLL